MAEEENIEQQTEGFKPNMYPLMYWALAFGVVAGLLLFGMLLLSRYITLVWFPVFLAGLVWGGYRNYKKQKDEWYANSGVAPVKKSAVEEIRDAVSDITTASRTMMAENAAEDEALEIEAQEVAIAEEEVLLAESGVEIPEEELVEEVEAPAPVPVTEEPVAPPAHMPSAVEGEILEAFEEDGEEVTPEKKEENPLDFTGPKAPPPMPSL